MNKRERLLAIAVGALMVIIIGWLIQGYVFKAFEDRRLEIGRLESELKNLKRQVQLGQRAAATISDFEQRSLPADPEIARSLYHDWLLEEIGQAGLIEQDVRVLNSQVEKGLYALQTFQVSAKGTLPQVVDLLHTFYSVDWLHRIKVFTAKPVKDTKLLELSIHVETLSLNNATSTTQLPDRTAQRLRLADREAYHKAIVGRNLFGPPNQAPRLTVDGAKSGSVNRQVELTARATDADPLDKVKFTLVESTVRDARFDATSGRLSWTPRETGKYEFTIQATDDGFPNRTSEPLKVVINITDPPPERPRDPPRLAFDHAKFTVLTAVLDIGGTAEVWLHVRPTGETLKLHTGDKFEIGSIKGTVGQIGDSDFVFESEGKQRRLDKGEILEQARSFATSAQSGEPDAAVLPAGSGGDL